MVWLINTGILNKYRWGSFKSNKLNSSISMEGCSWSMPSLEATQNYSNCTDMLFKNIFFIHKPTAAKVILLRHKSETLLLLWLKTFHWLCFSLRFRVGILSQISIRTWSGPWLLLWCPPFTLPPPLSSWPAFPYLGMSVLAVSQISP